MTTALYTHPSCLLHEMGPGHPESPDRLAAILAELQKPEFAKLLRREAPAATIDQIARVHDRAYVEAILKNIPKTGYRMIDPDTALSPHSGQAALHAAGSLIAAVDEIMSNKMKNAFCAVRPPGHHAEHASAMGFCFFNNIAIGAAHALAAHKLKRVAIVDFDVHHGNGTEEWAKENPEVLFCSSHQFPFYPGTGSARDQGPHGNIVNCPLPQGADGQAFRAAMENTVLPRLEKFHPEFIFISAGFDAHQDDPLAGLRLTENDFAWITEKLVILAATHCQGRIISTLEGGYDTAALAASAGAHVKALLTA